MMTEPLYFWLCLIGVGLSGVTLWVGWLIQDLSRLKKRFFNQENMVYDLKTKCLAFRMLLNDSESARFRLELRVLDLEQKPPNPTSPALETYGSLWPVRVEIQLQERKVECRELIREVENLIRKIDDLKRGKK